MDPREAIDRLRAVFGGPDGHRTLHAKGRFYDGTFTATAEATDLCRAVHLDGRAHPVLVRWSTGSGHARTRDTTPDIRGMAVSFRTDGGAVDLLGQTSPRFPTEDPAEFVTLTEALSRRATLPLFLARHPRLGRRMALAALGVRPHHSFAEPTYYTLHAYGWLDAEGRRTWVRHELRPTATYDDRLEQTFEGRDRLGEEMAARLARGPVTFELWVQVAGEGHDPDRVTVPWRGARELLAGRLEVTGEAADPEAGGSPTVFDPTRVVDGVELSADPILLYRPAAYSESASRRTT